MCASFNVSTFDEKYVFFSAEDDHVILKAIGKFPTICSYVGKEEESDKICRNPYF